MQAGRLIDSLVPKIEKTAELVQEISAASREQDAGADQIARAIQQLDSVIQQNATASEEMASTAEELNSQSEQLQQTIAYFRVRDGRPGFESQGLQHPTTASRGQARRVAQVMPQKKWSSPHPQMDDEAFERF